jgi:MscS family membrane protein
MLRALGPVLLALLLLAGPAVAAGGAIELRAERPLDAPVPVAPDAVAQFNFTATNAGEDGLLVSLRVAAPAGWNASAVPPSFDLPPRGEGQVRTFVVVVVVPADAPPRAERLTLQVVTANSTAGVLATQDLEVRLEVTHTALVLGLFRNPMPAPFDNAYGVFLLDLVFWSFIAITLILLQDPILLWLSRRAEKHVSARIVQLLRVPVFIALLFLGLTQSWAALPPSWWVLVGQRMFASLFILVAMYVTYKAFRAVTYYYIENIASKTESELDDILVPVLEKVGAVVIVAGGLLYFIGTLGIDLTAFVAGGVVVSMVLAFAAQDTLSNFFAGLFLMLDRPFVQGDDIIVPSSGLANEAYRVDQVGLRSTRLYQYSAHQLVTVPNNELAKNPIINLMHPDQRARCALEVGVGYDSDVEMVKRILFQAATEHPLSTPDPIPIAQLTAFGDSALTFTLAFHVRDVRKRGEALSAVRERVLAEFRRAGIDIPYPQRVVHVKGLPGGDGPGGHPPGPANVVTSRDPAKRS